MYIYLITLYRTVLSNTDCVTIAWHPVTQFWPVILYVDFEYNKSVSGSHFCVHFTLTDRPRIELEP